MPERQDPVVLAFGHRTGGREAQIAIDEHGSHRVTGLEPAGLGAETPAGRGQSAVETLREQSATPLTEAGDRPEEARRAALHRTGGEPRQSP
jgi:hypothetical protein